MSCIFCRPTCRSTRATAPISGGWQRLTHVHVHICMPSPMLRLVGRGSHMCMCISACLLPCFGWLAEAHICACAYLHAFSHASAGWQRLTYVHGPLVNTSSHGCEYILPCACILPCPCILNTSSHVSPYILPCPCMLHPIRSEL